MRGSSRESTAETLSQGCETSRPVTRRSLLLLFVDGIGLDAGGPENPFSSRRLVHLNRLVEGGLTRGGRARPGVVFRSLDACLDMPGLPQSATGQTTLFTGVNAAKAFGRHVTAYPGPRLRAILEESNLLSEAAGRGAAVAFANAFSPSYFERLAQGRARRSVTVVCTQTAGSRLRTLEDLDRGEAVSWDVERDLLAAAVCSPLARVSAPEAGTHLGRIVLDHDLTVYETFLTDLVGHRRTDLTAVGALERIDGLVGSLLETVGQRATVVLTSDHGNLEATDHKRHTRNPVPLLAVGPRAQAFAEATSLCDVTPRLLEQLQGASQGRD